MSNTDESQAFLRKQVIRQTMQQLGALQSATAPAASHQICQAIATLSAFQTAIKIASYAAFQNEVDLAELFRLRSPQQTIFLPRFDQVSQAYLFCPVEQINDELICGKFGVLEPRQNTGLSISEAQETLDLWLVPGLAFDPAGQRLGRGRGFYDQFLRFAKGFKLGVAYSWQLVADLPVTAADVKMDGLVTEESRWPR